MKIELLVFLFLMLFVTNCFTNFEEDVHVGIEDITINTPLDDNEINENSDLQVNNLPSTQVIEDTFQLGKTNEFIVMVKIPEGSFHMGAPGTLGAGDDESPSHLVNLEYSYWMSKYEITQKQWNAIKGGKIFTFTGSNLPADNISWHDAKSFVEILNDSLETALWRLPTEAEWEYAARGGNYLTRFWYGHDANYLLTRKHAWTSENSGGKTHTVGTTTGGESNPYGLWDMGGNVWEWCEDWYHWGYIGAPSDGSAWIEPTGTQRIIRGGSLAKTARQALHTLRSLAPPPARGSTLGFRIVRDVEIMTGIR